MYEEAEVGTAWVACWDYREAIEITEIEKHHSYGANYDLVTHTDGTEYGTHIESRMKFDGTYSKLPITLSEYKDILQNDEDEAEARVAAAVERAARGYKDVVMPWIKTGESSGRSIIGSHWTSMNNIDISLTVLNYYGGSSSVLEVQIEDGEESYRDSMPIAILKLNYIEVAL